MDFNGFWQENRRFVLALAGSAAAFAIGLVALRALLGDELAQKRTSKAQLEASLARSSLYSRADQEQAQADRDALAAAVATLEGAVGYEARAAFRLDPKAGPAAGQYHAAVAAAQAELLPLASRANLVLDRALGLPALSPTREDEIERYLQALDAVDRIVRAAVSCELARVDQLEIRLDPALYSRAGADRIERTQVRATLVGPGDAVARFLRRTQDPSLSANGKQGLLIEETEVLRARDSTGEARVTATFVVARLRAAPAVEQ